MPPSMNGGHSHVPELNKDTVSDEIIELFYEVIERAQPEPDLTTSSRTLLDVYEHVLNERGIQDEDNGVRLQLLTRLTRDARQEEGLMQRFKRVLDEIGLHVDHNEDGEGLEITSELHDISTGEQPGPVPVRRASLNALLDGSADKIAGTIDVGHELAVRSKQPHGTSDHTDLEKWWQEKRRSRSDTEVDVYAHPQIPHQTRSNAGAHGNQPLAPQEHRHGHKRGVSASIRGRLGAQQDGIPATSRFRQADADSEYTDESIGFFDADVRIPGVNAPIPDMDPKLSYQDESLPSEAFISQTQQRPSQQYEPFRPSDTRLMDEAETFQRQRLHSLVRSCIHRWRERATEQVEQNEQMMRRAVRYDQLVLFKGVKSCLLYEAQRRRLVRDTDTFFGRLEAKADKARKLFLLTKAFTHWAEIAEDQVQRTSVARRHILRTRFFNGWREITVVNELKIQHFVLGRFLDKWRRRTAQIRDKHDLAVHVYEVNLQRQYYKDWFFKFCEIAAPAWHNARRDPSLKDSTFHHWHRATMMWIDRDALATVRRNRQIERKSIEVWQRKAAAARVLELQAEQFQRQYLLTNALAAIQRAARFAPSLSQFQTTTNARRLSSILQTWRQAARLSRQAKSVDRMRVLRNAWTAWNDLLRIKALEERINDRLAVENMYKWTLASRVSLFQRVHNRTLQENVFSTWLTKSNEQLQSLERAERRFAQFKRAQILRTCLRKVESATAEIRAEAAAVTAQYELNLKQRIFDKLLVKHNQLQQLNRWAGDAQFYVLTTHTMKKWRDATQHARRNRRREAYAQVRRTVKLNLVKKTFGIWRGKSNVIAQQNQQADETIHVRTVQNSQTLLSHWYGRTADLATNDEQAVLRYNNRLQARFLDTWKKRLATVRSMNAHAVDFRQISIEVTAATLLKKLDWERTQLQMRDTSADLRERHFKKHFRAMFMFWHQRTRERIAARPVSPTPTARSRDRRSHDDDDPGHDDYYKDDDGTEERLFDDDAGDETRRLECWTEFDQNALDLSFSILPQNPLSRRPLPAPPPSSRPLPTRPRTYPPPPRSALRPRPAQPSIPEHDLEFAVPDATSTPMPHIRAGYLKTPSKRSVVRSKRSELLGSPEKQTGRLGAMSAPPAAGMRDFGLGAQGGLTSFQRKLREGGYGKDEGPEAGRGRVGFGNVQRFG